MRGLEGHAGLKSVPVSLAIAPPAPDGAARPRPAYCNSQTGRQSHILVVRVRQVVRLRPGGGLGTRMGVLMVNGDRFPPMAASPG
jgi:hypothetical protein